MSDETAQVAIEGLATGGDGLAHWPDGRVAFVPGALPGEQVVAQLVAAEPRHVRARLVELSGPPSPLRREPPCAHRRAGCGGCDWMHVDPAGAPGLEVGIVAEALARVDGLEDVVVGSGGGAPSTGYRTTVRVAVDPTGRPAYHRARSSDLVVVDSCPAAHPLVEEVLAASRFPGATEVVIRAGARTGQRLVLVEPTVGDATVDVDVRVVGGDELDAGRRAWIFEEAAGRRWRLSARSFFQSSPEAAEALVDAVAGVLGSPLGEADRVVDLYAGVGLFAGTVGSRSAVTAVESSPDAAADARVNLDGVDARVVRTRVERFRPRRADVVVADPPRRGLGRQAVTVIDRTGADRLALVSCDVGALTRDAGMLVRQGWRPGPVTVVDAFPLTSRIEVVSGWTR